MAKKQRAERVKAQHYVPRSYLKRFGASDGTVWVFDKTSRRSFATGVMAIAQEKFFYDIDPDEIADPAQRTVYEEQGVEKAYAQIEAKFSAAVEDLLLRVEHAGISEGEKSSLSFFLTVQLLRTREARAQVTELHNTMLQMFSDLIVERNFPEIPREDFPTVKLKPSGEVASHNQMVFDEHNLATFSEVLNRHIWLVGINTTAKPLYTSDHPVVRQAHVQHPILSFSGIGSKGVEVAFPLTSKHILILLEREHFHEHERYDRRAIPLNEETITYYNCMQVRESYRQVYCRENDFDLAREYCARFPDVCHPERARVEVNPGRR